MVDLRFEEVKIVAIGQTSRESVLQRCRPWYESVRIVRPSYQSNTRGMRMVRVWVHDMVGKCLK